MKYYKGKVKGTSTTPHRTNGKFARKAVIENRGDSTRKPSKDLKEGEKNCKSTEKHNADEKKDISIAANEVSAPHPADETIHCSEEKPYGSVAETKNSSTPRRKKNPLANLYSSLSPKYIGFSTPKSAVQLESLTPGSDEKGRLTRRKRLNNESAENLSKINCNSDIILVSPDSVSYVRRTNCSNNVSSPASSCGASELPAPQHQRSFESPIDKLLRKNRSSDLGTTAVSPIAVFEPRKPIERKELMDIKVKVARVSSIEKLQKNGVSTFQLDQHDNVINGKNCNEIEKISPTHDENLKNVGSKGKSFNKTIQPQASCKDKEHFGSTKQTPTIEKSSGKTNSKDEIATEVIIIVDESDESIEEAVEDCQTIPISVIGSNADDKENGITIIQTSDNSKQISDCESEPKIEVYGEGNSRNNAVPTETIEKDDADVDKDCEDDHSCKSLTATIIEVQQTDQTDANKENSKNKDQTDANRENSKNTDQTDGNRDISNDSKEHDENSKNTDQTDANGENSKATDQTDGNRDISNDSKENDSDKLHSEELLTNSKNNTDLILNSEKPPDLESSSINSHSKKTNEPDDYNDGGAEASHNNSKKTIEQIHETNAVRNSSSIQNEPSVGENDIPIKSPSSMSLDSAKGSSVNNDILWMSFATGDIFWGQIYSYSYWPCMICPDPDGKTISSEASGFSNGVQIMVHVRFFADNARRNWVKRENLLAFVSLEDYVAKMCDAGEKYGKKHPKYKAFVVSKGKKDVWNKAVEEAMIVLNIPQAERLEKFYEIFESSKALYQLTRKRRQSKLLKVGSTSDIGSLYDSSDNISSRQSFNGPKRDRSISPFSPAYSPVSSKTGKRRKLSESDINQTTLSANSLAPYENDNSHLTINDSESSLSTTSYQKEEIFNNIEFKKFMNEMKEFVMEQNSDEKLERSLVVAVRNLWALRHINKCQMKARLLESLNEIELGSSSVAYEDSNYNSSFKRLSNRLRNITSRQSLTRPITPVLSYSLTQEKEKMVKSTNRPIEEVIDDIFNLENKYLFRGLGRDPVCKYCLKPGGQLLKCSKMCQLWLHVECNGKSFDEIKKKYRGKKTKLTNSDFDKPLNKYAQHITADDVQQPDEGHSVSAEHMDETFVESTSSQNSNENSIVCHDCARGAKVQCAVCKSHENELKEDVMNCNVPHCLNVFHPTCCRYWPQTKITKSKNKVESFRCPSHVCHTCVSDDPKGKFQNISSTKLTKCVKCPASFHTDSTCIPAGSQILTSSFIICPRHSIVKTDQNINVNWCFICVKGGQVVCCETCPTAVHATCLNIPIDSEEGYICEECETGRMPLYGEMVWAKFNNFRWWPAIILPPTEIPENICRISHNPSDFVVRFFGTHDHGWISRRRVYLYLEGDSTEPPKSTTKTLDHTYKKGVEEAKKIWEIVKAKKLGQRLTIESKQKLHPQPYVKLKANRAVPPVKLHIDLEKVNKCECDKSDKNPCGPDSNCLNRVLYHECNPKLCPAGERCQNQMFESRVSPKLEVVYMKERGFGLICRESISAGTFVIEYVGEVINDAEFRQRLQQKSVDRDENFYFLSLEKDYIIDAGPKGNLARFMNHSCSPNCETQKWSVNGLDRVGLFAIADIPENTELTFNYHWDDLLGNEKKTCFCGAAKCAGQIGGKFKETKIVEKLKSKKINVKTEQIKKKSLKRLQNKQLKAMERQEKTNKLFKIKTKAKAAKLTKRKLETSSSDVITQDEATEEIPSTSSKANSN